MQKMAAEDLTAKDLTLLVVFRLGLLGQSLTNHPSFVQIAQSRRFFGQFEGTSPDLTLNGGL